MSTGDGKTTILSGKVQLAQDGSVAKFIPTGAPSTSGPFPTSGLQGVILSKGLSPMPCFLSPPMPNMGGLFYSATLVKRTTSTTVKVTTIDKKTTFLAKYTPPSEMSGSGSLVPLDNVALPSTGGQPMSVTFTSVDGGSTEKVSGTVTLGEGTVSFAPDPVTNKTGKPYYHKKVIGNFYRFEVL